MTVEYSSYNETCARCKGKTITYHDGEIQICMEDPYATFIQHMLYSGDYKFLPVTAQATAC